MEQGLDGSEKVAIVVYKGGKVMRMFRLVWIMSVAILGTTVAEAQSRVKITGDAYQGYQLLVNGEPFVIKGVGGSQHFDVLAASGGNATRTWGVRKNTLEILDQAHEHGIMVVQGIWLGHESQGFDYSAPAQLERQRQHVEEAVKRFKDHPALLVWGLGNEMEGVGSRGDSPAIWREINELAKRIKALDPNHPVMTVVANVNKHKVRAIQKYAPEVDILGVNVYGGAGDIGRRLRAWDWTKPYTITEFGLPGPWEVEKTSWGAPIEPSSRQKAGTSFGLYNQIMEDTHLCLGSFAFLWGHKHEATASWFGMFLPNGDKTVRVDAMTRAWTGEWPANRAPVLKDVEVPVFKERVKPGDKFPIRVRYEDPDGDTLTYTWEVFHESSRRPPDSVPGAVRATDANGRAVLTAPSRAGAYRLFVTVSDGQGAGVMDNWPFYVVQALTVPLDPAPEGSDGDLQLGRAWPNPRFTDHANGTVTDNLTGLIWLKNADVANTTTNWAAARDWVVELNTNGTMNGNAAGDTSNGGSHQTDWRLPSVMELRSLIALQYANPALCNTAGTEKWSEGNPFTGVQSGNYWSSATYASNTDNAWFMDLGFGVVYHGWKSIARRYVWPVRGGQ